MNPDQPAGGSSPDATGFAGMWSSDGVTRSLSPTGTLAPADLPFLFGPGQRFGPYLIIRPLGKGGMGQVYEAEEAESGRRVAVKILSHGLGDGEEREQFLREGQLAASLSHPNTVYVFGTTEVQGFPVIAMELAPGGTLKDLVVPERPLPVAQAVDAILQVIAGLDAAAALGILHRDVKPSNCFIDRAGRVLVGDFGLSMMTTVSRGDETMALSTSILGTPGFASPEQLRGTDLDRRSDIYSVGATLYYLLTGRPPFDDRNVAALISRVATEAPPSLTSLRPDIPKRLGSIVARCLAKSPGERYASYAALVAALEPFRSEALSAAPFGRRFLAGWLDSYFALVILVPLSVVMGPRILDAAHRGEGLFLAGVSLIASLVYYTIAEGWFGCGAGKAVFNLRVIDASGNAPGPLLAFLRALVFLVPTFIITQGAVFLMLPYVPAGTSGTVQLHSTVSASGNLTASVLGLVAFVANFACLGVLFSTARQANGKSGLHDLVTGTRVVLRPSAVAARGAGSRTTSAVPAPVGIVGQDSKVGPYLVSPAVRARASSVDAPAMVAAYDDRLRRGVWLELLPLGAAPVDARRRDLGRPGRIRWLSGRRTATECWDAYEAVDGTLLVDVVTRPQPWARVRHWLADLAKEITAGSADQSLPPLRFDRIWIGSDERARLLDWAPPAPGAAPSTPATAPEQNARRFLYAVASAALRGAPPAQAADEALSAPLPLAARALLLSLHAGTGVDLASLDSLVTDVLRTPAVLSRSRRAIQMGLCAVLLVVMPLVVAATVRFQERMKASDPLAFQVNATLGQLATLDTRIKAHPTPKDQAERDAIEIYVAEHLRDAVNDSATWAKAFPTASNITGQHGLAEKALADHPTRSPEEVRRADVVAARLFALQSARLAALNTPRGTLALAIVIVSGAGLIVAVMSLLGALIMRGGFTLRMFGMAVVKADGTEASRGRALWRAVVTWTPIAVALLLIQVTPSTRTISGLPLVLQTLPLVLLAAGAAWTLVHPDRAIQDRIAGTWIVPR